MHSALRELRVFTGSPRFWMTFVAVVLLFAFTGPFGTGERLAFAPRLGFWFVIHACSWSLNIVFVVIADVGLRRQWPSMFGRMLLGATLAALPVGAANLYFGVAWFGEPTSFSHYLAQVSFALPLDLILCALTYMAMSSAELKAGASEADTSAPDLKAASQSALTEPVPTPAPIAVRPAASRNETPLNIRLKPENRGALMHLSVEDHYTMVTTSRGRELILLRFSDAMRETGTVDGLQVHRSHWVARDFVRAINRDNGKITIVLNDGSEIPVSRTYAAAVRQQFSNIG